MRIARNVLFSLIAVALVQTGTARPDDQPAASDARIHTVVVPAGMKLVLQASFEADLENEILIWRDGQTEPAVVFSNRKDGRRATLVNDSDQPVTWHIRARNRSGGSWYSNRKKVLSQHENTTRVGFEDQTDGDYDDGQLVLRIEPTM